MNRSDLAAIAKKHGVKRGQRPTAAQRQAMRAEIADKLTASEVTEAPRIFGDSGSRPMTLEDAVNALVEEIT